MKNLSRWLAVGALVVGVLGFSFVPAWGDTKTKKEVVKMDDLPAPVKDAITKEAGENKVTDLVLITKGDEKRYEAEWLAGGKKVEINVSADGKVTEREAVVTIDQVPAPVKEVILREAGQNTILEVEEITDAAGNKTYEAEYKDAGKDVELKIAADGKLLEKETE